MSDREQIIASMAADFETLPQWLRDPFEPFRDTVVLLMERRQEELARNLIAAIPTPAGFDESQVSAFSAAVAAILSGLDAIIAARPCNQPEFIAAYEATVQARLDQ
jgi:hypothetical protein